LIEPLPLIPVPVIESVESVLMIVQSVLSLIGNGFLMSTAFPGGKVYLISGSVNPRAHLAVTVDDPLLVISTSLPALALMVILSPFLTVKVVDCPGTIGTPSIEPLPLTPTPVIESEASLVEIVQTVFKATGNGFGT
jgi:hypothetical protein